MTDFKTKGTMTDIEGKAEETAGKLTGNEEQELHGQAKQVQGQAQKTIGDIQDKTQDTLEDAKDAVGELTR
jgi:uncharacterized protein YjbJ (UPF0337 family)